jgi:hypothetical protein
METVVTFLVALVISWFIVYGAYGLMGLATRCILWVVRRLCQAVRKIRTSSNMLATRRDGIAAGMVVAVEMPPPSSRVAICVRQAREALFEHERQAFYALSEMRETAARTHKIIAEARALIIQAKAMAEGMRSRA